MAYSFIQSIFVSKEMIHISMTRCITDAVSFLRLSPIFIVCLNLMVTWCETRARNGFISSVTYPEFWRCTHISRVWVHLQNSGYVTPLTYIGERISYIKFCFLKITHIANVETRRCDVRPVEPRCSNISVLFLWLIWFGIFISCNSLAFVIF